mgnify:CR=1 FL=1
MENFYEITPWFLGFILVFAAGVGWLRNRYEVQPALESLKHRAEPASAREKPLERPLPQIEEPANEVQAARDIGLGSVTKRPNNIIGGIVPEPA